MNPDFFVANLRYLLAYRGCTQLPPISGWGSLGGSWIESTLTYLLQGYANLRQKVGLAWSLCSTNNDRAGHPSQTSSGDSPSCPSSLLAGCSRNPLASSFPASFPASFPLPAKASHSSACTTSSASSPSTTLFPLAAAAASAPLATSRPPYSSRLSLNPTVASPKRRASSSCSCTSSPR